MKNLFQRNLMAILVGGLLIGGAPALAQNSQPTTTPPAHKQDGMKKHDDKKADKEAKKDGENDVKVGDKAPEFTLKDTDGKEVKLSDFKGKIVVLEWFNPDCPFVKKHHDANKTMVTTFEKFKAQGVVWLAINSGAAGKEGAGLERNKQAKADWKLPFPILLDETGKVGKTYGAKRTPEMYIINKDGTIAYEGAIDNNRDAKTLGDVNHVEKALAQVVKGETVTEATTKAYGCTVKY